MAGPSGNGQRNKVRREIEKNLPNTVFCRRRYLE